MHDRTHLCVKLTDSLLEVGQRLLQCSCRRAGLGLVLTGRTTSSFLGSACCAGLALLVLLAFLCLLSRSSLLSGGLLSGSGLLSRGLLSGSGLLSRGLLSRCFLSRSLLSRSLLSGSLLAVFLTLSASAAVLLRFFLLAAASRLLGLGCALGTRRLRGTSSL